MTSPVLFVCICVLNYCHRVATQLQLNMSYHNTARLHSTIRQQKTRAFRANNCNLCDAVCVQRGTKPRFIANIEAKSRLRSPHGCLWPPWLRIPLSVKRASLQTVPGAYDGQILGAAESDPARDTIDCPRLSCPVIVEVLLRYDCQLSSFYRLS